MRTSKNDFEVIIVGAGFSGMGMAIRLKQAGIHDFAILERGSGFGGVWRENTYPGCACDIESVLYSFSFAPNPDWSNLYAGQAEIWKYLEGLADRYELRPHIRANTPLEEARWVAAANRWRVRTPSGELTARFLVSGAGALNEPLFPKIKGIDSFQGRMFHSAQWDHEYPLEGKRVAVIGTGASAIQFIPKIQPKVDKLTVFQRTPPWIIPRRDREVDSDTKKRFRRLPLFQKYRRLRVYARLEIFGLGFRKQKYMEKAQSVSLYILRKRVKDPVLLEKLTPHYTFGCKRVLLSDDYYPALVQPNVDVVTDAIQEIRANSIVTADGREHQADAIILGTGFRVTDFVIAGKVFDGEGNSLKDTFQKRGAYCGTTVPGFPNFFFLLGPNTGLGHNSILLMVEAQIDLALKAIRYLRRRKDVAALDVKPEKARAFSDWIDEKSKNTVWLSGCRSWYLDKEGRNPTIWPLGVGAFRRRVRAFRARDYRRLAEGRTV